mmetsp:Transcript_64934/g.156998  ORF Transcript_64934/g.156998 Transcript_64934/m.156998 type:complete len:287 (+) Transcript_64934:588-1448(+)
MQCEGRRSILSERRSRKSAHMHSLSASEASDRRSCAGCAAKTRCWLSTVPCGTCFGSSIEGRRTELGCSETKYLADSYHAVCASGRLARSVTSSSSASRKCGWCRFRRGRESGSAQLGGCWGGASSGCRRGAEAAAAVHGGGGGGGESAPRAAAALRPSRHSPLRIRLPTEVAVGVRLSAAGEPSCCGVAGHGAAILADHAAGGEALSAMAAGRTAAVGTGVGDGASSAADLFGSCSRRALHRASSSAGQLPSRVPAATPAGTCRLPAAGMECGEETRRCTGGIAE